MDRTIGIWDIVGYFGLLALMGVVVAVAAWSLLGPVLTLIMRRRSREARPLHAVSEDGDRDEMPPDPFFR